jgi:hypothetical protein
MDCVAWHCMSVYMYVYRQQFFNYASTFSFEKIVIWYLLLIAVCCCSLKWNINIIKKTEIQSIPFYVLPDGVYSLQHFDMQFHPLAADFARILPPVTVSTITLSLTPFYIINSDSLICVSPQGFYIHIFKSIYGWKMSFEPITSKFWLAWTV